MALLDERKRQAAEALANGANASAIARELGVDRATVGRWKQDPDFQAAIQKILEEAQAGAVDGLHSLVPASLRLLEDFLSGNQNIPANRATAALNVIKAAAAIDRGTGEGGETQFEERLKALDARQSAG